MEYSVVIPTFNRKTTLNRALSSVFSQSLLPAEVIVVDDGSDDGTAEWVAQYYPKVILLQNTFNQGVSAARNKGIQFAKTNWIAFLDSDDEWLPEKMHNQSIELSNSGLLVCHTEEIWIRNGVRVNSKKKHQKKSGDIFSDCLRLCAMSPSAIVLHRRILDEFGGFDENFIVCEDYDLWLRVCAKYQVALVENAMIKKYGGHSDQLSQRYFGMDKYRVMAMEKLLKIELNEQRLSELHQVLLEKLFILKQGAEKHGNDELLQFCASRAKLVADLSQACKSRD